MEIKKKRRRKQRGLPDDMKGWKLKESAALPPSDRPKPASLADQPTKPKTWLNILNCPRRLEAVLKKRRTMRSLCPWLSLDRVDLVSANTGTRFPEGRPEQLPDIRFLCPLYMRLSQCLNYPPERVCVCWFMSKGLSHNNWRLSLSLPPCQPSFNPTNVNIQFKDGRGAELSFLPWNAPLVTSWTSS